MKVQEENDECVDEITAPVSVRQLPRFKSDVRAMKELTDFENPPKLLARPRKGAKAVIIFGDASGEGFGSSL